MGPLLALLAVLVQEAPDGDLPRPAPGWKVTLVARAPAIRFPSAVACAPDGRVFVGEDPMDQVGPVDRPVDRVRCVHPDGRITTYAEGLGAVFGLAYLEGRLYVQHAPHLSVFRDAGDEGRDRRDLVECTLPRPWEPNRQNEHVPSNFRLGMDGRFYASCGSKGIFGAKGSDGRAFQMRMGGIWTFRPDGSRLEVHAEGTRNTLDVALNEFDDAFLADNNCHMAVWPSGLFHARDGAYFGYPYHYKPLRPPAQPAIADLGYGACTGLLAVTEGALPEDFDNDLVLADWGRSEVARLDLARKGATWDLVRRDAILSGGSEFRPIAIDVSADGLGFYIADWNHPGGRAGKDVGRLLKLEWRGPSRAGKTPDWYPRVAAGGEPGVSAAVLLEGLGHPDRRIRLAAQRALVRGGERRALETLLADPGGAARGRRHALWALHELGAGAEARIAALGDRDPLLRAQAARAFGLGPDPRVLPALRRLASDPDPVVRLHATIALGRSGDAEAVPALIGELGSADGTLASAAVVALRRIGAWAAAARLLGDPRVQVRERAALVFHGMHDTAAVSALAGAGPGSGAEALRLLADLHLEPPRWDGTWWRRGPHGWTEDDRTAEARIDQTERWEGSAQVESALRAGLDSPEAETRKAAADGIGRIGDAESLPALRRLLAGDPDVGVRGAALRALSRLGDRQAASGILRDPAGRLELLRDAVEAVARSGSADAGPALVRLLDRPLPPEDRVALIDALSQLGVREAVPAVASLRSSREPGVAAAALAALGRLGAAEELVRSLGSGDAAMRNAAIRALAPLKSRDAVPALLEAWKNPDTRAEALDALTLVPDPRAREAYRSGLDAKSTNLRGRCRSALKAAGGEVPLAVARQGRDEYARFAAGHAGSAARGRELFHGEQGAGCAKCHAVKGFPGGDVGPDLSGIGGKYSRAALADSVLYPSRQIAEGYRQLLFSTRDGDVVAGALRGEDARELTIVTAEARRLRIRKEDIVERRESALSLMPEGIEAGLSLQDFADLVSYLESLR